MIEKFQQLVNDALPIQFGDGSRYGLMLDEYFTNYRAVAILLKASQQDEKLHLPTMLLLAYGVELSLKCLSYYSHEGNVYSITGAEYNSTKNMLEKTGIYKVNQGTHTCYKHIIVHPYKKYDLQLRKGTQLKNNKGETYALIDDKLMENKLAQEELFAIFKNYAPYPQTHKCIDIFKSINKEYQQNVFHKFKDDYCYYQYHHVKPVNDALVQDIKSLTFERFEGILKDMHNFTDFRYLCERTENLQGHNGLLSSLHNAVRAVIVELEKSLSS